MDQDPQVRITRDVLPGGCLITVSFKPDPETGELGLVDIVVNMALSSDEQERLIDELPDKVLSCFAEEMFSTHPDLQELGSDEHE